MITLQLFLFVMLAYLLPFTAFAADPVAAVAQATSWLNGPVVAGAVGAIAVVLELAFRLIPTETPLSWMVLADNLCKALSSFFQAVGQFLDKVIPQNLKK